MVETRHAQVEEVKEMLQVNISLDLELIPKDTLPEEITAKHINAIEQIIK